MREEVPSILRVSPGDYTVLRCRPVYDLTDCTMNPETWTSDEWISDAGYIRVRYDSDRVIALDFEPAAEGTPRNGIEMLWQILFPARHVRTTPGLPTV